MRGQGRNRLKFDKITFEKCMNLYLQGEINAENAAFQLNCSPNTFKNKVKQVLYPEVFGKIHLEDFIDRERTADDLPRFHK